jgi:SAM-dependent methyltransferase
MAEPYLMAGQLSELERLQLQARVWNPFGVSLLRERQTDLRGARVLDIGCGALGWLPVLSIAVGVEGRVVGTDIDEHLLAAARASAEAEGLTNVELVVDDLFASALEPEFDLVHARFQLAPLGRANEQVRAFWRLLSIDGLLVLEEPDPGSWHFNPPAPEAEHLIQLIIDTFAAAGGDFGAGRRLADLVREHLAADCDLAAHVIALPPGHPYLRLPLQFSASLRPRMLQLVTEPELDRLLADAERELEERHRWGTTFTLIQAVARVHGAH